MKKRHLALPVLAATVFIGVFLFAFILSQNFFSSQIVSNPVLGSVAGSSLTNDQINQMVNVFSFESLFFSEYPAAAATSPLPNPLNVFSAYNRTVISNSAGYDFAPSVMNDRIYKMWWCGNSTQAGSVFAIYYATSNDSINWSARQLVLQPTAGSSDYFAVCQPSVVKVNSTFYMYYAGLSLSASGGSFGANSSIFLATSSDGINWTKYPSNANPQPVLFSASTNSSILNQPSALFYNNSFYLYYSNASSSTSTDIYLAKAADGINFAVQNNAVFSPSVGDDRDVRYLASFGKFFMAYGSVDTNKIYWTTSDDGVNWQPFDSTKTSQTSKYCNFGPAILGYGNGTMDNQTVVYYAAGTSSNTSSIFGCFNPSSWTIDASSINISQTMAQAFNSTSFVCSSITGGFNCKLSFSNTLNESAIVEFLFVDKDGNVVMSSVPTAAQGISQVSAFYSCTKNSTLRASWRAFRSSDANLSGAIAWSKTNESQLLGCQ